MISEREYISVSEYAGIKGISKQAVYKQLNNKLKPFLIVIDSKKYISIKALNEVEQQQINQVEQPIKQPFNNQIQPILTAQLEEKDKLIDSLLRQIETLQEQNSKLTDLLHNSQYLLVAEKQQQFIGMESQGTAPGQAPEQPTEKKGIFSFLKRRK